MRFLPLFTLVLGFSSSVALAQPELDAATIANPPIQMPRVPRPGTPQQQIEFDIRKLFKALNTLEKDRINFDVSSAIAGGRIGYFGLSEWVDAFLQARGKTQFVFDHIEFEKVETDTARMTIVYSLLISNPVVGVEGQADGAKTQVADMEETLDVHREALPWENGEKWRLVPPTFEKLQPYRTLSLQHIAYFASQRAGTLSQLRAEISASRLKRSALGVLQFVQDYDEQFAFENEFWRDAIHLYVQNDTFFFIPGTQTPYTFNDNLSAKSHAVVNEAAQTVMFYEGENEKPVFRYDGKAVICFTDGHVAFVSPEEAKSLIWKP